MLTATQRALYHAQTKDKLIDLIDELSTKFQAEVQARVTAEGEMRMLRGQIGLPMREVNRPPIFKWETPNSGRKYGSLRISDPKGWDAACLRAMEISRDAALSDKSETGPVIYIKCGKLSTKRQFIASSTENKS